jgi:hypothetical protein
MPETLWSTAVQLARKHGVYRISQDLGVNYDTLKARLTRLPEAAPGRPAKRSGKSSARAPRFVELKTAAPAVGAGVAFDAGGVVVVVEDGLGGRLSIRLGSQVRIEEVCALVAAFRDHAGAVGRR